ncbi:MAG TPA: histidine kinase [Mucilaginibacter sp.]|nr:histidine kinase [Mucilaginibacter sp.]
MFQTPFFHKLIFDIKYRWLRYILLSLLYFIVITTLDHIDKKDHPVGAYVYVFFFPILLVYAGVFIYFLIPAFLLKKKYLTFFLSYACLCAVGLIIINIDVAYFFLPFFGKPAPAHFDPVAFFYQTFTPQRFLELNFFPMFCVFIKLFKLWYIEQQQKHEVEREKLNAQLELLKAQLHPHFLFNTLNNLYSLVYEKSDRAPKVLLRLSSLLSYILYDCKANEVLLSNEIAAIRDYVLLERERYGDRLDISMDFSGDIDGKMIAPMLFQPFIENAFKHGSSEQLGQVWISIGLSVKKDQLYFKIINSYDNNFITVSEKHGVGIENVKKRLELLYPGRFHLQNGKEEDIYVVSLSLELYATEIKEPFAMNVPELKYAK